MFKKYTKRKKSLPECVNLSIEAGKDHGVVGKELKGGSIMDTKTQTKRNVS